MCDSKAVSWLTKSRQLDTSWLGVSRLVISWLDISRLVTTVGHALANYYIVGYLVGITVVVYSYVNSSVREFSKALAFSSLPEAAVALRLELRHFNRHD